jgi:hypothetical protein
MSFSDFDLKGVTRRFDLKIVEQPDLFGAAPELPASPVLRGLLADYYPLAKAINTEKARSEFLIAPVLAEVRARLDHRVSLFSGVDFPAAPDQGLSGICDFIMSRSPEQQFLSAPLVVVIEAKNENIKSGLGQCVAAMIGARLFNEREGNPPSAIFGAVTSGTIWQFLRLENPILGLDERDYHIGEIDKILGILTWMLRDLGDEGRLVA